MRIFGLFAAVTASPLNWVANTWWKEVKKVYDFASNNRGAYTEAVNYFGDAIYEPSFVYCGGDDGVVSALELTVCGAGIANYLGVSEEHQNFVYNFAIKYWNVVDLDDNGALDFEEFKLAMGGFAATNAAVAIAAYDSNDDGKLSGAELTTMQNQAVTTFSNWGWSVDEKTFSALHAAYANAQMDENLNTCSMLEFARFQLKAANVFLQ